MEVNKKKKEKKRTFRKKSLLGREMLELADPNSSNIKWGVIVTKTTHNTVETITQLNMHL